MPTSEQLLYSSDALDESRMQKRSLARMLTRSEPRKRKATFDIEAEELDRWVQSDYDDMVIVRD